MEIGTKVRIDLGTRFAIGTIAESRNFQGFVNTKFKHFVRFDKLQRLDGCSNIRAATIENDLITPIK